ncbi:pirin family protein [Jatrophihabitans sp. DSM 45814]
MTAKGYSTDVRLAGDRQRTRTSWLDSAHSFSFGHAYDPENTHFGFLLVNNEDVVAPSSGFDTHPHRDMEIVTWVISGSLVHQDSEGNNGLIYPGLAQRMSAGSGILHSEKNDGQSSAHFVQMWVLPDEAGIEPGYEQLDISDRLAGSSLVPVASGLAGHRDETAIRIQQRQAGLSVARLADTATVTLPSAPYVHVFVAHGSVAVEGISTGLDGEAVALQAGDAVRLSNADGQRVTAIGPAELLVWEMHGAVG